MAWEPAHEGYANRSRHDPSCPSTPTTCECGATDLWALSDEEEALTQATGKWVSLATLARPPQKHQRAP